MKALFLILIILHALIHLLAFLKAFDLAELKEFTSPVSKPMGLIWLLTLVLLILASILFMINHPNWWIWGIIGAVISQILIFQFWQEAKFGSIPNLIIIAISILSYAQSGFDKMINKEIAFIQKESSIADNKIITKEMVEELPYPVKNWLEKSGVVGKPALKIVQMEQAFEIKLRPEQNDWFYADAEQYISSFPPAFVWKADMKIMHFLSTTGRDKFIDGEGEMLFKILSVFPVANDGYNPQINEAALQRFLGEIVWIPSAALEEYINWEAIDQRSSKGTMTYKGTTGSGVFTFNEKGELEQFSALRYMGSGVDAKKTEWVVKVLETKEIKGIKIPVRCDATWRLDNGDWTWSQFQVKKYNF
jgi:hypothetical protein